MDLLNYLTPEERAAYSKKLAPTTGERIGAGASGFADAMINSSGGRSTFMKDFWNQEGQNQDVAQNQMFSTAADRRTTEKEEIMKALTEKQRGGVLDTIEKDYPKFFDEDLSEKSALELYKMKKQGELSRDLAHIRASTVKPDHFHERQATHLGDKMDQSGMIPVGQSIDSLAGLLKEYTTNQGGKLSKIEGKDIPGFGYVEGSDWIPGPMRSPTSRLLRQEASNLRNKVLQSVGGKNLTKPEVKYALDAIGTGAFKTEDQLINGINIIRDAYNADMENFYKSVTPQARNLYETRQGAFYEPQSSSGLTPEEEQELLQLEQMYGE